MNNNQIRLMGVLIRDRKSSAAQVQSLLTEYGCSIKTRLGLHEASDNLCAPHGLVLLELTGSVADMDKLEKALNGVKSVEAKVINFAV
ncbi:MAG: hypothetical protein PHU27_10905 [Salinivirgaceae bacterium]|nr:hypothetical protein [Salinivirgaceae bacterium]MDD4748267.1 hypothetical protein [Salinivirgaceae bacterium]MDY0280516.1 hypothetical protein [Salinivirgaceae bacterium]